jgi:hypothetical protein
MLASTAQTSIDAFAVALKDLPERQFRVIYALVKLGRPVSNKEIAVSCGLPINCITPRVLELREFGLVIHAGERKDPATHRRENLWTVADHALADLRDGRLLV